MEKNRIDIYKAENLGLYPGQWKTLFNMLKILSGKHNIRRFSFDLVQDVHFEKETNML